MIKNLLCSLFLCIPIIVISQNNNAFCEQLTALDSLIKVEHYKPKIVNDSLSKHVFKLFISNLDNDKRFFIEKDIQYFKEDEFLLDNFIIDKSCQFIDKYIDIITQRLYQSISYLEDLKYKDLDYSGKDVLHFRPKDKSPFFKNENASSTYWSKRVRYLLVSEIIDNDSIIDSIKSNFKKLESQKKHKIIDNQICLLQEILNQNGGIQNFVSESFLNAFVQYQDPNSTYFNAIDKTVFENTLATNQETFGIITRKSKKGEIIISHVIPGSSAFKNGSFEKDDIIKSLKSGNNILEIHCIKNKDIVTFLNDENNKVITFKIKKSSGSILEVELSKTKLKVEENSITGYILNNIKKLGYIKIPSFYTNLESHNKRGLTADFAKELYKLQRENIEGLIIDLRHNGGGSMKEAIELSGMFVNKGPVSIIRDKKDNRFTFKDPSRGTFFNKPIIVLINNYSASASEFFASTMQDYNRAILVGSTTHGKSSAQVILPLHKTKNLGYSKITTEAFYRITGKSLQSFGVIPDIELPSIYNGFKINEIDKPYALSNDTIHARMKHLPLKKIDITSLREKSERRIKASTDFASIQSINKNLLKSVYEEDSFALTVENIFQKEQAYQAMWNSVFNNKQLKVKMNVTNSISTEELLSYNENEKTNNKKLLDNLSKDIYIHEAHNILTDLINANN